MTNFREKFMALSEAGRPEEIDLAAYAGHCVLIQDSEVIDVALCRETLANRADEGVLLQIADPDSPTDFTDESIEAIVTPRQVQYLEMPRDDSIIPLDIYAS